MACPLNRKHGTRPHTGRETERIEGLRRGPDRWARFDAILALTEVDELLAEEVRRLGGEAMHAWAAQAEARGGGRRSARGQANARKAAPPRTPFSPMRIGLTLNHARNEECIENATQETICLSDAQVPKFSPRAFHVPFASMRRLP